MNTRLRFFFQKLAAWVTVCSMFAVATVDAAPVIDSFSVNATTVTVNGSAFGAKPQAAPVMWVFGDDIRLNGKKVSIETNVSTGSVVPINTGPNSSLWTHGEGVYIDDKVRTPSLDHSYVAKGNGWVGWPYAFGGSDTPYSTKAFISWRVRTWGDINAYKAIAFNSLSGDFLTGGSQYLPGEDITVQATDGQTFSGRIVSVDTSKRIVDLELASATITLLQNAAVVGKTSGAKLQLDPSSFYRPTVGTKYFRSYENVTGAGTRAVMSTNRWISLQYDSDGNELRRAFETKTGAGYGAPNVSKINDWVLMESYIDLSGNYGNGYISANNSSKKWFNSLYIGDSKPKDAGLTISNLGWEAAGGTEMINASLNFGEIYFDTTPQRVILSNSETYEKAGSSQEFQWIKYWNNEKVTFDYYLRGLNEKSPIFMYIFDENNSPNIDGICIFNCDKNLPPTRVQLNVN